MDRKTFIFYESYMEMGSRIKSESTRCRFYEAIFRAALKGEPLEDTGDPLIDMAYIGIRPLIEANIKNYQNGCKGGAPKGTVNNPKGKNQHSKTTAGKPEDNQGDNPRITAGKPYKDKDKDVDKDKDSDKDDYKDEDVYVDKDEYEDSIEDLPTAEVDPDFDWFEALEDDRDKLQ